MNREFRKKTRKIIPLLRGNQSGQTLIEVLIAVALVAVLVGAMVQLSNTTNRRASFAKQAEDASKLAEEGMEIVRHIRDSNQPNTVRVGNRFGGNCALAPFCSWADLYSADQLGTAVIGQLTFGCVVGQWCLVAGAGPFNLLGNVFSRRVEISDSFVGNPACAGGVGSLNWENVKQVEVVVNWNAPGGLQERRVVSCLGPRVI